MSFLIYNIFGCGVERMYLHYRYFDQDEKDFFYLRTNSYSIFATKYINFL